MRKQSLLFIKPKELLEFFSHLVGKIRGYSANEREVFVEKANALCKYYSGSKKSVVNPLKHLEKTWFNSLNTKPAYSVYADDDYLLEVWACWRVFSRSHIKNTFFGSMMVPELVKQRESFKKVVDVGCGVGLSTAALSELFPNAEVFGTNLADTEQFVICEEIAEAYRFKVLDSYSAIGNTDLVLASEYFEHFIDPYKEIEAIITSLNPTYLIVANSFNTIGIGHFKTYKMGDYTVDAKQAQRYFMKVMRRKGYKPLETKLWNNTPQVFKKLR